MIDVKALYNYEFVTSTFVIFIILGKIQASSNAHQMSPSELLKAFSIVTLFLSAFVSLRKYVALWLLFCWPCFLTRPPG